ncbi:MAG: hypothetical protein RSF90_04090 [Pygmaiobacter sp.]
MKLQKKRRKRDFLMAIPFCGENYPEVVRKNSSCQCVTFKKPTSNNGKRISTAKSAACWNANGDILSWRAMHGTSSAD